MRLKVFYLCYHNLMRYLYHDMCILKIFMRALEHLIIFLHLHMLASEKLKLNLEIGILLF
jgi:hypothetical protein